MPQNDLAMLHMKKGAQESMNKPRIAPNVILAFESEAPISRRLAAVITVIVVGAGGAGPFLGSSWRFIAGATFINSVVAVSS